MKTIQQLLMVLFFGVFGLASEGHSQEVQQVPPNGLFGLNLGDQMDTTGWTGGDQGNWWGGTPPEPDPRFETYYVSVGEEGEVFRVVGQTATSSKRDACTFADTLKQQLISFYGDPTDFLHSDDCERLSVYWSWDEATYLSLNVRGGWSRYTTDLELMDWKNAQDQKPSRGTLSGWTKYLLRILGYNLTSPIYLPILAVLIFGTFLNGRGLRRTHSSGILTRAETVKSLLIGSIGSAVSVVLIVFLNVFSMGYYVQLVFSAVVLTGFFGTLWYGWIYRKIKLEENSSIGPEEQSPRMKASGGETSGDLVGTTIARMSLGAGLISVLGGWIFIYPPLLSIGYADIFRKRCESDGDSSRLRVVAFGRAFGVVSIVCFLVPLGLLVLATGWHLVADPVQTGWLVVRDSIHVDSKIVEGFGLALWIVGGLVSSWYWIRVLIVAFRTSMLWGLGCVLIPFLIISFVVAYWNPTKVFFLRMSLALLLYVFGLLLAPAI